MNRYGELVRGRSRRRKFCSTSRISPGSGKVRCFLPLPRTCSCASANFKSSSWRVRISHERRPSSNIRPTTARSRKVRKLAQKFATCSADSGWITRCGCLRRRPKAGGRWGRPKPSGQRVEANPIAFIHDVGAGGLSNAFPELVKDGGCGGSFDLNAIPRGEAGLSPLEAWCNEAQERYVLAIAPENLHLFDAICERERCPFAVIGMAEQQLHLTLSDHAASGKAIDLPLQVLFGKPPKMERGFARTKITVAPLDLAGVNLADAVERLLRLPTIAAKSFLITIGDRSITGMVVQDQMVGPWQVPVADCAVTLGAYDSLWGEAMAVGERTPLAVIDAASSARMAVGEVITNLAGAAIGYVQVGRLGDIKLSANWMASAGEGQEDQKLFDAVHAVGMEFCPALGMTIPGGKDSMSMKTKWVGEGGETKTVVSPLSLVVSGFAPVSDVRRTLTPQLCEGDASLILIDLGQGKNRLGGSCLAQVYGQVGDEAPDAPAAEVMKAFFAAMQHLNREGKLLAYHDRSDGGLFVTLVEMAFAGRMGLEIDLPVAGLAELFSEELGAVVQVAAQNIADVLARLDA